MRLTFQRVSCLQSVVGRFSQSIPVSRLFYLIPADKPLLAVRGDGGYEPPVYEPLLAVSDDGGYEPQPIEVKPNFYGFTSERG
jgi:hypothetical protein